MANEYTNTISIAITAEDEASAVIQALQDQLEKTQEAVTKSTSETAGAIDDSTANINDALESQIGSWDKLTSSISEQTSTMEASIAELTRELTGSISAMDKSIGTLPDAFSTAATSLAETKVGMEGTMDDLVMSVDSKNAMIVASFAAMATETKASLLSVTGGAEAAGAANSIAGAPSASKGLLATLTGPEGMTAIGTVVAGVVAVKMYSDFQTQLTRLYNTAGELGPEAQISAGIQNIASTTGFSVSQLTSGTANDPGALYNVSSAGFNQTSGLQIAMAAAKAAEEEGADPGPVAKALATAMLDTGASPKQANSIMNEILATVAHGNTTLGQITPALSNVLTPGTVAGLSLPQILAPLATLTASGVTADEASQQEKDLIQELSGSFTKGESTYLQNIGIDPLQLETQLPKLGITGEVNEINNALMGSKTPAGLILQSTFNNSTNANKNLQTLYNSADPKVRALIKDMENGMSTQNLKTLSRLDLNSSEDKQFLQAQNLYDTANGFNSLFTGNTPADQTVQAAYKNIYGNQAARAGAQVIAQHANTGKINLSTITKAGKNNKDVTGWGEQTKLLSTKTKQMKQSVEGDLREMGGAIAPVVTHLVSGANDIFTAFNHVATGSSQTDKTVREAFKLMTTGGYDLADKLGQTLWSIANDFNHWGSNISGAVSQWWDMVVKNLGQFASNLGSWASHAIDDVINFFTSAPGKIGKAISGWWSSLNKYFSTVYTDMYNAGKDMIDGLAKGISDFAHKATDNIKNVGSDVVSSFKNLLGIHSPSTVFAEAGMNIGQGLAQGIASTKNLVHDATKGIAPTPPTVQATANVAAQASLGGNVTLNVYVGNYMGSAADQQKLAASIWQSLQNIARQHGAASQLPQIGILPT